MLFLIAFDARGVEGPSAAAQKSESADDTSAHAHSAQEQSGFAIARPDEARTLGTRVPNVWFLDEHGDTITPADLAGVPIVINPVFTSCRHICPAVTSSLIDATKDLGGAGRTFNILVLSFDPTDTPAALSAYRKRVGIPPQWRMACGTPENLDAFLGALDFNVLPMPGGGFAHPNAAIVLSSTLEIRRYLNGMMYDTEDLKAGLRLADDRPGLVERAKPLIAASGLAGLIALIVIVTIASRRRPAG